MTPPSTSPPSPSSPSPSSPGPRRICAVVTGMHRGGTTWFGALIAAAGPFGVIHEPFNRNHGLPGVPDWYLDPQDPGDLAFWDRAAQVLCAGRARFRRPFLPHAPMRSLAKMLIGSEAARGYARVMAAGQRDLVLKCPFLTRFVPHLDRSDIRTIVIVRHPGAIMGSLDRMGWALDLAPLRARGWVAPDRICTSRAETLAVYWRALFAENLALAQAGHLPRTLFVSHERFFDDVDSGCDRIAAHLGLPAAPPVMRDFARASSAGHRITPPRGRVHDLHRDSQQVARGWRARIDPATLRILEAEAGPIFAALDALW